MQPSEEHKRLEDERERAILWKLWGPYLSERQWGTVREDYSKEGDSWEYFTHDQARSRAYHWGEDGIAGISDVNQELCFALAFWNGKDPILKERLFGLTNSEGNHGEDVKEYYFYLDNTPTHSYMKYLYKYAQEAYPYLDLLEENKRRTRYEMEYELIDTGIFDEDSYFDIFVEYAKAACDDILISITIHNRGAERATLHLLPTIWFRNTWSWWQESPHPSLEALESDAGISVIAANSINLGHYFLYGEGSVPLLFTENETNNERLFGTPNLVPYVKDGINRAIVDGEQEAVNAHQGTKAALDYRMDVEAGGYQTIRLRLSAQQKGGDLCFGKGFDELMRQRREEADAFYSSVIPASLSGDAALVMRQALAGMLWSKQYYLFDAAKWLTERHASPFSYQSMPSRNKEWIHLVNNHIISMPDKWEYPWYASWDLAFHTISLSLVDLDFAKQQIDLMLREDYQHPSGQIPAYEWNFSDVNPPVHAWAILFLNRIEQGLRGKPDLDFLKRSFAKLSLNFTWWVNRKDRLGKNIFDGGFLGLDNIGVFDRSKPLPMGGYLEQADGTAWMSFFCQNMLELSIFLTAYDSSYESMALKFAEHFLWIANAINKVGEEGMWDEEDGFYYDILRLPNGESTRLKVRSIVGLLPLCATTIIEPKQRECIPKTLEALRERAKRMPELLQSIHMTGKGHYGEGERGILALINTDRLRRILSRMLDENEFLSPYGIRALSKYHLDHPYCFNIGGQDYRVTYLPAESDTGMFGGNSNWRGPIWMPINLLIIKALLEYYLYYGDSLKLEFPTGSGHFLNLFDISREIAFRLASIFLRNEKGIRPVYGGTQKFQDDPHWRDYILFYEYFHGDNGAGLGASHQTGWTGVVAKFIQLFGSLDAQRFLKFGKDVMLHRNE